MLRARPLYRPFAECCAQSRKRSSACRQVDCDSEREPWFPKYGPSRWPAPSRREMTRKLPRKCERRRLRATRPGVWPDIWGSAPPCADKGCAPAIEAMPNLWQCTKCGARDRPATIAAASRPELPGPQLGALYEGQIGRASCRERVEGSAQG